MGILLYGFSWFSKIGKGGGPIKDLIKYIVQALVDNPEQVEVSEIEGTRTSIIEVRVANKEYGQVIGKQGRNADAIRTILRAASAKDKKRSVLEIVE